MSTTAIRALIDEYLVSFGNITAVEHNAIETAICDELDALDTSITNLENTILSFSPKNNGYFTGLDVGSSSGSLTVSGDITAAVVTDSGSNSIILLTFANAMDNTDYDVQYSIQSISTNINDDNDLGNIVFKPVSTTQCQIAINEFDANAQNLKIRIKVYQNT